MRATNWRPGDVVVWSESWRGTTYYSVPVRVVEDSERQLVYYLAERTRFRFPPGSWPFADQHPWAHKDGWSGHGVLLQYRPGAAHTVWHFWQGAERRFAGWYVNMQEPLRRGEQGFDTQDQELDLWVAADGTWQWKDEAELRDWVHSGRFTEAEAEAVREEGERVLAEWPFPTGWEDWRPDPSWDVPELPDA
jgi:hypothetical protein